MLVIDKSSLYLAGDGQTSEGLKPFISRYNYKTGKTEQIYRMKNETELEKIVSVIDIKKGNILSSIQQPTVYPKLLPAEYQKRKITSAYFF